MSGSMPRYQTKSAYAAGMLRQAFADGKYASGDRLQIARVAKELGLSLTPVREALLELANEGLVDMQPHRGARVGDLHLADLADVYLVRELLEPTAARLTAERATDEDLEILTDCHQRFVSAVERGERDSLRALSDDFHQKIYELAQAPLLRRLIQVAWMAAPTDTFTLIDERAPRSVRDHEELLAAIRSRDGESAEELMRTHIRGSLELIRAAKEAPPTS